MYIEYLGVSRRHVAVHDWVHAADLQPESTVTAVQLAVDERAIRVDGRHDWLSAAVDLSTSEIRHSRLFHTQTKGTARWFLAGLHRQCRLDSVTVLADAANHLVDVLRAESYDVQVIRHENHESTERIVINI